jgi:hypothetical protein
MTRKLQFDRQDSKARRKRLNFVLNNPEEAVDQAELDGACRFAEWMTEQTKGAIDHADEVLHILEDPNSEFRLRVDSLKDRMHQVLDGLRKAITSAESVLVEKYKGRCASIELTFEETRRNQAGWALLFWHVNGVWGLYTINHNAHIQRLINAPKHVRIAAVDAMYDILNQLQYEDEAA